MNSNFISDNESVALKIPRIVIAGIQSGCGKTSITRGVMAALKNRGLNVQPFKIGPDFIDPTHHTSICNRVSQNLDLVMAGEDGVLQTFLKGSKGADIAVIEGVMGMYDGLDGSTYASSAHIARILKAPLLLVIPVKGMSASVHAIASGFKNYEPETQVSGVILNQVGSERHKQLLNERAEIPQLGYVPYNEMFQTESRHLGLLMADETESCNTGAIIEETCDISMIFSIARSAPPLEIDIQVSERNEGKIRIGVAKDPAFCFYYQHNLDLLSESGGILEFWSPMQDPLPEVDVLYLGGGYPELYAENLESGPGRDDIRRACDNGMPVWAECGGLLYLTSGISGEKTYKWAGVLPGESEMCNRFQALGYVIGKTSGGTQLTDTGLSIRGHEFHYSSVKPESDARYSIILERGKGIIDGKDGLYAHETVGCYTHSWFSKNQADRMIIAGKRYRKR